MKSWHIKVDVETDKLCTGDSHLSNDSGSSCMVRMRTYIARHLAMGMYPMA